jgi:hypothetical protein
MKSEGAGGAGGAAGAGDEVASVIKSDSFLRPENCSNAQYFDGAKHIQGRFSWQAAGYGLNLRGD